MGVKSSSNSAKKEGAKAWQAFESKLNGVLKPSYGNQGIFCTKGETRDDRKQVHRELQRSDRVFWKPCTDGVAITSSLGRFLYGSL